MSQRSTTTPAIVVGSQAEQPRGGTQVVSSVRGARSQSVAVTQELAASAQPVPEVAQPEQTAARLELEQTLLSDTNPSARRGAIDKLSALPESEDALIRTLISDPDPLVRRWSAMALERRPPSPTVESGIRQALVAEANGPVRAVLERSLAAIESEREGS